MKKLSIIIVLLLAFTMGSGPFSCDDTPTGYGLEFDGVDDYVQVNHHSSLDRTDLPVTLAGWVKPDPSAAYKYIFGKAYKWSQAYGFRHDDNLQILISIRNSSGDAVYNTGYNLTAGEWQHIALTHDGTSTLRLYLDGENGWTKTDAISIGDNGNHFYIGRVNRDIADGGLYEGQARDVCVYDSALSTADVETIMNGGVVSGLISRWKLDEGSGSTAYDNSGNDNHGTLYGNPVWLQLAIE